MQSCRNCKRCKIRIYCPKIHIQEQNAKNHRQGWAHHSYHRCYRNCNKSNKIWNKRRYSCRRSKSSCAFTFRNTTHWNKRWQISWTIRAILCMMLRIVWNLLFLFIGNKCSCWRKHFKNLKLSIKGRQKKLMKCRDN